MSSKKGITLITLVITIIVILILVGVTLSVVLGENGLINRGRYAAIRTDVAMIEEKIKVEALSIQTEKNVQGIGAERVNVTETLNTYGIDATPIYIAEGAKSIPEEITVTEGPYYAIDPIEVVVDSTRGKGTTEGTIKDIFVVDKNHKVYYILEGENKEPYVPISEIFDINGENATDDEYDELKAHIGDFVNYDAGTWEREEINSIRTGTSDSQNVANGSINIPNMKWQFGGFVAGQSRNESATPINNEYNYVQEKLQNGDTQAITGWRIFDVDTSNNIITIISAGCPEDYYIPYNIPFSTCILTGRTSDMATLNNCIIRNWNMYINSKASRVSSLTYSQINNFFNKYMGYTDAAVGSIGDINSIYNTQYESLIDNYSYYFADCSYNRANAMVMSPREKAFTGYGSDKAIGIRVIITLKDTTKISSERMGTKTITSRGTDYTYNIWDLK